MGQSFDETTPSLLNGSLNKKFSGSPQLHWLQMGMSTCLPRAAKVWYEDLSGSGWAAAPGTVYEFGTLEYSTYIQESARNPGSRAVILIDVHKNLLAKTEAPGAQLGLRQFWTTYNLKSIDRLTGLITAPFTSGAFQSTLKVYKADRNFEKDGASV
ncbi:hypothetical protein B0H10DRAFT_1967017 [Mycena sp. CBHHK59/15]|nr:hypothetical protein B0H10DRAFT_1967017 [Mycena sp. CBHHK59/15]